MENGITIFEKEEFGSVRTITIDDEPWFVGKDVALALGYAKTENAIAAHVDEEDKTTTLIQGEGSNYKSKAVIINESGVYALVFGSKLPTAKRFKRWVTSEVLPALHKQGYYDNRKAHNASLGIQLLYNMLDQLAETERKANEAKTIASKAIETTENVKLCSAKDRPFF